MRQSPSSWFVDVISVLLFDHAFQLLQPSAFHSGKLIL